MYTKIFIDCTNVENFIHIRLKDFLELYCNIEREETNLVIHWLEQISLSRETLQTMESE